MGQYLSAPVTTKETSEGYHEALGYGLAAMQGWRVSMEDAHIADLNLDPHTKTSLFAIFDGHGGKAVAKFSAQTLARELINTPAYKRGDLRQAIVEAYYRLDEILDSDEGREELRKLVGAVSKKQPTSLFSGIEENLHGGSSGGEAAPEGGAAAAGAAAGGDGDPPPHVDCRSALPSTSGEADCAETAPLDVAGANSAAPAAEAADAAAAAPAPVKDLKKQASQQFLASHLMRVSVLPPGATEPNGSATAGGGGGEAGGGGEEGEGGGSGGEEGEEENAAAGMGCTAVSVLVRGDHVLVANTGDSRCVLSRKGQAIALTLDHKPILFEEARRIIKAGGFVRDNRINGALNVSRTIGDLDFKRNTELPISEQMVVATPDIETFSLREGDEFIILACDGIWDVMSNQEAVDFVRKRLKSGMGLMAICEAMCDACLAPDLKGLCRGADNMSIIIVLFRKYANLGGWWNRLVAAICSFPSSGHKKR